jgi:signal transduction histidine kinase
VSETGDVPRVVVVGHAAAEIGGVGLRDASTRVSVVEAASGSELFETHLEEADVVVIADAPPDQDSLELYDRIRDADATIPVLVALADRDPARLETVLRAGVTDAVSVAEPDAIERLAARIHAHAAPPVTDGTAVAARWGEVVSTVAHDVKNPMTVLVGRVDLVEIDPVHEDAMTRSIDRVVSLQDDLSTLGTVSRPVTSTEAVDVTTVARTVWDTLETADASLEVTDEWTLEADRDRLTVVFECLLENAVVHGGADVTVSLEPTPSGFAVADDGPGIPLEEREKVLEQGYGTTTGGEGYGLFVAATAVEAHGWTIEVGESDAGGARLEVDTRNTPSPR